MVWSGAAYRSLEINENGGGVANGYSAEWATQTPSAAIKITGVYTPLNQVLIDCAFASDGFTAQFYLGRRRDTIRNAIVVACSVRQWLVCYGYGINRTSRHHGYFGWARRVLPKEYLQRVLTSGGELVGVRGISLQAEEDTGPTLTAIGLGSLWYEGDNWVRGTWPLSFVATDPSGVCATGEWVGDQAIQGPADTHPDTSNWQQCPNQELDHQVDTTAFPNGALPLELAAANAAGVWSSVAETVQVDNQPVTLSLSGPTDAPSTAGTQYIAATANAGPSGVHSISCTVDGQREVFSSSTARIPVQGLGAHHVTCVATNNSDDNAGRPNASSPQDWTTSIREPSVSTVSFAHLANVLHCSKITKKVQVPGRWTVEQVHGHKVRVRIPAQTRTIKVTRCHPRVVKKRVKIGGRWVIKRIVLLPKTVQRSTKRIKFGKTATISGWLGTSDGTAIPGQRVDVLTAADNGHRRFKPVATTATGPDGTWSVRLPAGPSRLVRAAYGGTTTIEPAISGNAHLIVPASVKVQIDPRRTHWGGKIAITGQLRGGYVPHAGELVVLWISWRGGRAEIGHIYAKRGGRFETPYTFLRGRGTETYHVWAVTAREGDYPYAPSRSRPISVTVGA